MKAFTSTSSGHIDRVGIDTWDGIDPALYHGTSSFMSCQLGVDNYSDRLHMPHDVVARLTSLSVALSGAALGGGSRGPDPLSPDQGHLWEAPRFDEFFFWGGKGEDS